METSIMVKLMSFLRELFVRLSWIQTAFL